MESAARSQRRPRWPWLVAGILVLALAAGGAWWAGTAQAPAEASGGQVSPPEQGGFLSGLLPSNGGSGASEEDAAGADLPDGYDEAFCTSYAALFDLVAKDQDAVEPTASPEATEAPEAPDDAAAGDEAAAAEPEPAARPDPKAVSKALAKLAKAQSPHAEAYGALSEAVLTDEGLLAMDSASAMSLLAEDGAVCQDAFVAQARD